MQVGLSMFIGTLSGHFPVLYSSSITCVVLFIIFDPAPLCMLGNAYSFETVPLICGIQMIGILGFIPTITPPNAL